MKKLLLAATLSISSLAFAAEPELKPAQEEAKDKFDTETADAVKQLNEKCGTKATLKSDFQNFNGAEWEGTSFPSYCSEVISAVTSMCEARPAYKKAIGKKLTSVACLFTGAKAEKEHSNATTQHAMSFEKGSFTYHMVKGHVNLGDNAKAVLEKALN